MSWRFAGLTLMVFLVPFAARAQETPAPKTAPETAKTVEELDQEIEAIKTTIQELKQQQDALVEQLDDLAGTQSELTELQREQAVRQQQVLDSIAKKDGTGNEVLRLSANMEASEEFRQEMQKAVHSSLEQKGTAIIRNKMATEQRIKVNQTTYNMAAGETLTLQVPVGTLTTKLPGQPLVNWAVTPPDYQQTVDIVPESETRVTRFRPTETTETTGTSESVTTYRPATEPPPVYLPPVETYYVDPPTTIYWPLLPF